VARGLNDCHAWLCGRTERPTEPRRRRAASDAPCCVRQAEALEILQAEGELLLHLEQAAGLHSAFMFLSKQRSVLALNEEYHSLTTRSLHAARSSAQARLLTPSLVQAVHHHQRKALSLRLPRLENLAFRWAWCVCTAWKLSVLCVWLVVGRKQAHLCRICMRSQRERGGPLAEWLLHPHE
jgi:hypothetical protein